MKLEPRGMVLSGTSVPVQERKCGRAIWRYIVLQSSGGLLYRGGPAIVLQRLHVPYSSTLMVTISLMYDAGEQIQGIIADW